MYTANYNTEDMLSWLGENDGPTVAPQLPARSGQEKKQQLQTCPRGRRTRMELLSLRCIFLILSSSSQIQSSIIPGRTDCSEGYILWPVDSTCHRLAYQGPCGPEQVLVDHQQGPYCQFIGDNDDSETDDEDGEDFEQDVDMQTSSWSVGSVIEQPPQGQRVGVIVSYLHLICHADLHNPRQHGSSTTRHI